MATEAKHRAMGHEVRGSASFQEMAADVTDVLDEMSDYLGAIAPRLQQRIAGKMRREGLHGRGILGTTEDRAAKSVTDPIAQVAEWLAWCVQAMKESQKNLNVNVIEPIEQVQALMRGDDPFEINH